MAPFKYFAKLAVAATLYRKMLELATEEHGEGNENPPYVAVEAANAVFGYKVAHYDAAWGDSVAHLVQWVSAADQAIPNLADFPKGLEEALERVYREIFAEGAVTDSVKV